MGIKKITSFTYHTSGGIDMLSFTYTELDENGNFIKENERVSTGVVNQNILENIDNINKFLIEKTK